MAMLPKTKMNGNNEVKDNIRGGNDIRGFGGGIDAPRKIIVKNSNPLSVDKKRN